MACRCRPRAEPAAKNCGGLLSGRCARGRSNPEFLMDEVVQMAFERRLEAVVSGPGLPGQLKVTLGRGQQQFVADVPVELLDPSLRLPNSEFVAVVNGRDLVR